MDDRVDHSLSEYCQDPDILRACKQLWKRPELRTDQIVWCYIRDGDCPKTHGTRVKWILEVPDEEVILTDLVVWNRIIGETNFAAPPSIRQRWTEEAVKKYPYDPDGGHRYREQRHQAYCTKEPPPDGWWSELFIDDPNVEEAQGIVRMPVLPEWVVQDGRKSQS